MHCAKPAFNTHQVQKKPQREQSLDYYNNLLLLTLEKMALLHIANIINTVSIGSDQEAGDLMLE